MPSVMSRIQACLRSAKQGLRSFRKKLSGPTVKATAWLLAWVIWGYLSLVWRTSRVESYGMARAVSAMSRHRNILMTLWHENVVLTPWACREYKSTTLASRSDIGEVITAALKRQGFTVIRGGSSKGKARRTAVLKDLVQHVKERREVMLALAVDGSSGPVRVLKPGIIPLSHNTGAPIFACHVISSRAIKARTWDRTRFPLPFGRIVVVMEGPLRCDLNPLKGKEFRRLRDQAQLLLEDAANRAEHYLKHGELPPPNPALDLDPSYGEEDKRVGRSLFLPHEILPNPRPISKA
jgi:lysophospholipid acyltransferase (LPLAT)-like uncharacterized protein